MIEPVYVRYLPHVATGLFTLAAIMAAYTNITKSDIEKQDDDRRRFSNLSEMEK
jgi:hypothetical protein|tara:strand:+ start:3806 stop:3967 length:162 start_codon:yes stop_codon:yes gene_type:complete